MHRTCFVMIPFAEKFMQLYQSVLRPAIQAAGLVPEIGCAYEPGSIPDQIDRKIKGAAVGIAVLTGDNWNVAYEMGIAHNAGVPVLALIEGSPTEAAPDRLPFDIRHQRVFTYSPTEEGGRELAETLKRALPKLDDEHLLADMLTPPSLKCERSVIAASPLSYREARRNTGGVSQFTETYADHVGIRGLLLAFAMTRGFDCLPELWNPGDFLDVVLTGDTDHEATEMTVYSIGSPKSNRFTGLLMKEFFKCRRPRFAFVPDQESPDLRDVWLSLWRDGFPYHAGLQPAENRRWEDIGLILRGPNPFNKGGMMLVMAGRSALGTEAACRVALDARGVRHILQHLEVDATCHDRQASLSDYRRAFWAAVTMRVNPQTRQRAQGSLIVRSAHYFDDGDDPAR